MDANGQRFWFAEGGAAWQPKVAGSLELHPRFLRLASRSEPWNPPEQPAQAEAALTRVPMATDGFGTFARFDPVGRCIRASGALPRETVDGGRRPEQNSEMPVLVAGPIDATDLTLGFDGLLYLAAAGRIEIIDPKGLVARTTVSLAGFEAWRLAADPAGGVWALDRVGRRLARLRGKPIPPPPDFAPPPPEVFVPATANPDPSRLELAAADWLEAGDDPVAIACSREGRVGILVWTSGQPAVRLPGSGGRKASAAVLKRIQRPFSLAWLPGERFAVLAAGVGEALVYALLDGEVEPSGEVFPLRDHDGGPPLHGVTAAVAYGCEQPTQTAGDPLIWTRPLVAVSLPAFAPRATAHLPRAFDSGVADTAWHRLYVEAEIPPGTRFTLWAATSDTAETPTQITASTDWHPHHFGAGRAGSGEPRAAWVPHPSELPGQPGFIGNLPERDRSGLFTVLLQRSNRPVRTLRGRFLHLKIELHGNLRSTPCLFALRAYGPRFSYQDKYLPALYRESLFGPEAEALTPGTPSTRPDFLGRFLANFEGLLTPLEDAVAASWLVTDPRSVPTEAIDWLGSWIGVAFEPWYPAARRREHLRRAPELFRQRGTLPGLRLALDVATGGAVRDGRVVVVEDHWFRRTLQTVLGVNLDREFDALLGGPLITGNSKVGETLFLGEEGQEHEFLALFDAGLELRGADRQTVDDFFAALAWRATVIVHEAVSSDERLLIERVARQASPAHVVLRVRQAGRDLLLGLNSLLGAETYLRPEPPPEPVEVELSTVGAGGRLLRPASLDPRLEGTAS